MLPRNWLLFTILAVLTSMIFYRRHYGDSSSNAIDSGRWWGGRDFGSRSILLVKQNDSYGAFQLLGFDSNSPVPRLNYRWIYRQDGKSVLDPKDSRVQQGQSVSTGNSIQFGPFKIEWSASSFGRTYLYYNHKPFDKIAPTDLLFCVTNLEDFIDIDAGSSRWKYKGALRDPGN